MKTCHMRGQRKRESARSRSRKSSNALENKMHTSAFSGPDFFCLRRWSVFGAFVMSLFSLCDCRRISCVKPSQCSIIRR